LTGRPHHSEYPALSKVREPGVTLSPEAARSASVVLAVVLVSVYIVAFFVQPLTTWPAWLRDPLRLPKDVMMQAIGQAVRLATGELRSHELRAGLYLFVTSGLLPWMLSAAVGRWRPGDLGFRRPSRYGWRLLAVGYVVAFPFLVWMARGAQFADPYLSQWRRSGAVAFGVYYFAAMLVEHFLLQGVVLATCRPGRRWPAARSDESAGGRGWRRLLQWVGLAQPIGGGGPSTRLTAWLGLAPRCLPAVLVSGLMFGLVHFGKHPRELLLSLPGGIAQAWMAYRSNTWLIPFALHLATAATTLLLMLRPG